MPQLTLLDEPCGILVKISPDRRTATRRKATERCDNGIVFTSQCLDDNAILCATINDVVPTWTGCIQIGVTATDPRMIPGFLPPSAGQLKGCTWIYTGSHVFYNGRQIIEEYGRENLDKLANGDSVGVVRRSNGSVHFVVNGVDQGVAATNTPAHLFVVLDICGKCAQITISEPVSVDTMNLFSLASPNSVSPGDQIVPGLECIVGSFSPSAGGYQSVAPPRIRDFPPLVICRPPGRTSSSSGLFDGEDEPLRFHEKCGSNINLTFDRMSAERIHPVQQFNNGIVMSNRPMRDNEIFEIRIDAIVAKWSGSLEIGVTTHSPERLDFPEVLSRANTLVALSDLEYLQAGNTVGVVRRSNGYLHFTINGADQGVAAVDAPDNVYAIVDLYARAARITVVSQEADEEEDWHHLEQELCSERPLCFAVTDSVAFSTDLRTATFVSSGLVQSATLLSERPLQIGETFYLKLVALPLGAHISIGVAIKTQCENISHESGIWFFPSRGLSIDGNLVDSNYGRNVVTQVKKQDCIGVFISREGGIHFYYNNRDLGVALKEAPLPLWGVGAVLLGGHAPQTCVVSLVQPDTHVPEAGHIDLRFHTSCHGSRVLVLNSGLAVVRVDCQKDSHDQTFVTTNRCLKDNEIFELVIEEMEERWSGTLAVGVTSVAPEQQNVTSTGDSHVRNEAHMLCGSVVSFYGVTLNSEYGCDLDLVRIGTKIGVQRKCDSSLHFFLDGRDMGVACTGIPSKVWPIIDLFGQCVLLSILHTPVPVSSPNEASSSNHQLNSSCGHNVVLRNELRSACRISGFDNGLIFSSGVLDLDELFEIQIEQVHSSVLIGNVIVGLTTIDPKVAAPRYKSFKKLLEDTSHRTYIVVGRNVYRNNVLVRENYGSTALLRATAGERIGVEHCADGTMHVYVNGEDQGVAVSNLPRELFAVFDLFGPVESISLCSSAFVPSRHTPNCYEYLPAKAAVPRFLDTCHGANIQLTNSNQTAQRVSSFNEGIVLSSQPISPGQTFNVRLSRLITSRWKSSLSVGILGDVPPVLPASVFELTKLCWLVVGNSVYADGRKIKSNYGPDLDLLKEQSTVGIHLDSANCMRLFINGVDQGVACDQIYASKCFVFCDVYGRCEKIDIVQDDEEPNRDESSLEAPEKAHLDDNQGCKENYQQSPIARSILSDKLRLTMQSCHHHRVASHILRTVLCLPWHLFESQLCCCDACSLLTYSRGKSLKRCSIFTVKNAKNQSSWKTAYGIDIPIGAVRKCLDNGKLLARQELGIFPLITVNTKHHDGKKTSSPIVKVTPCLRYAFRRAPCLSLDNDTSCSNKFTQAKVLIQASICLDSYQKIVHTIDASSSGSVADDELDHNKVEEWHTKEKSATSVQAIIVRIE